MHRLIALLVLGAGLATPAAAMSIRGVQLSPTDAARVDRQCDALRFRTFRSLGSEPPDEPPPGYVVPDPSSYWSENADASDAALIRGVDLDAITVADCRAAGFYDN
ncbi:MAG: hypothetical protein ACTHLT_04135 [Devosia sp.]